MRSVNARRVGLLAGALGLSGLVALSCTLHFHENAIYTCTTDSDCEGDGYKCLAIPGRTAFCCKPEPEICDGKDNDCDGVIDNIEPWDCYDGPAGTEGAGLCHAGKQACNNGVPGRHSLRIRLQGAAGNPTGVGARITVELADGTTQTSEVYAGSGYYSQSTAACFFGYPDGSPPTKIRVHWPSGVTTEHAFTPNVTTLTLSAPVP